MMREGSARPYCAALLISGLLLTGCAPEGTEQSPTLTPGELRSPGSSATSGGGASPDKGPDSIAQDSPEELGNIEGRLPVETEKATQLPGSFPRSEVPLPKTGTIDDTGERADGSWFVVFRYPTLAEADRALSEIAANGGFSVATSDTNGNDIQRVLEKDGIRVDALAFVDGEYAVLSLDVSLT